MAQNINDNEQSAKSQCDMILAYLQKGYSISSVALGLHRGFTTCVTEGVRLTLAKSLPHLVNVSASMYWSTEQKGGVGYALQVGED